MLNERSIEIVFLNKMFGKCVIVVSLVKKDTVSPVGIYFYFNDSWVGNVVPIRGPLVLLRLYDPSI